jgi:hypothetical protein
LWRPSEATGQAGLDPESRRMLDDEILTLTEQEERRRIEAKSLGIEEWRSQTGGSEAGGDSDVGEEISARGPHKINPFQSSYNKRGIGPDEGNNVRPLEDGWNIHENRRLESQVYYTNKVRYSSTAADLELLSLPRHWHDAPSFPEATTTAFQPATPNKALMRWNVLSDNIYIASRAATCGSRRPSLTDVSEYDLDTDAFVERLPGLPNMEETRRKNGIFDQGLDRLANIVQIRSDSKHKRVRSSQNILEETRKQLQGKYNSTDTLAPRSRIPRRGLPSISSALAIVGRQHTRDASLGPLSPVEHLGVRIGFENRARSKSELNLHSRTAQIGLAPFWKPQSSPPFATLKPVRLPMGSEDEDEDENEEAKDIRPLPHLLIIERSSS